MSVFRVYRTIAMAVSMLLTILLPLSATANGLVGTATIEIQPPNPTDNDFITVELSGEWPNSCVPLNPEVSFLGQEIRIATVNPGQVCDQVLTPWILFVPIGLLEAGGYNVIVTYTSPSIGGLTVPIGEAFFDVTTQAPPCAVCDGDTVMVDQNVFVDFNHMPPIYTGDPDLVAYFTFDMTGPTPETWKAIFDVGAKKLVVSAGVTIQVAPVPLGTNNRRAPGIEIRSTCAVMIAAGGAVRVDALNQPAGDLVIKAKGNIDIDGTVSNSVGGAQGVPGAITIASCCGNIRTGSQSLVASSGALSGGDINLLTCFEDEHCEDGNIQIKGLVDASYKGGRASTINIASFDGAVLIDGNTLREIEPGTKRRVTSGVTVRSRRDPLPGAIFIQAKKDVAVFGNTILNWRYPNLGAVGIKTASNSSKGGTMELRSLEGRIFASDRAFDNADRFNTEATITLAAHDDLLFWATRRLNSVRSGDPLLKDVVSTMAGRDGQGGVNTLRSYSGDIIIGSRARISATGSLNGQSRLTSCSPVKNGGVIDPPDADPSDDAGVCAPPAPAPRFLDCQQDFGIDFEPPLPCGGIAGQQCASNETCNLRDATCSIIDLAGVCVPRPPGDVCITLFDPVCGCDGVTYSNDCERIKAGATLAHPGAC